MRLPRVGTPERSCQSAQPATPATSRPGTTKNHGNSTNGGSAATPSYSSMLLRIVVSIDDMSSSIAPHSWVKVATLGKRVAPSP